MPWLALCLAPNATLCAWRMYATRSAAAAARTTTRDENRAQKPVIGVPVPRRCASMRLALLPNRDPSASRAVCCCLELPWAISVGLAATLYTVPACGCFSLCP
jgi:hypothetical protein